MSKNPLLWKFLLILAVVGGALFFSYPPGKRINLGLDLRGGAHILMQVETATAVKFEVDQAQSRIGQLLKERGIPYSAVVVPEPATIEVRGTPADRDDDVHDVLQRVAGQWNLTKNAKGEWRATVPPALRARIEESAVDVTLTTLRNRIDALGVSEPLVQKQGLEGKRILIQLPGVENPERVKDVLSHPALLEWKIMTYPPQFHGAQRCESKWTPPVGSKEAVIAALGGTLPEDTALYPQDITEPDGTKTVRWWPLKKVSTVVGNDLRSARRGVGRWGDANVEFELSPDAGARFEAATKDNVGCIMAIVLGDVTNKKVISAPEIRNAIRTNGVIQGHFTASEADDLALQLRSGAMPTDVSIIEERTVGPSLGRDSIRAGLLAGSIGFLAVMAFMVLYYRVSGINAVVALALNVLLVFGTLGALPFLFSGTSGLRATLTLPGIAGLILTVGMAVDANVLIFERIRDELRLGKTVRSAVNQGFGKAFLTILDCNVTTVIAALFLGLYGTGPVRGFAVTLVIGLVASMFTAVFVSRQLFELLLVLKPRSESLSI